MVICVGADMQKIIVLCLFRACISYEYKCYLFVRWILSAGAMLWLSLVSVLGVFPGATRVRSPNLNQCGRSDEERHDYPEEGSNFTTRPVHYACHPVLPRSVGGSNAYLTAPNFQETSNIVWADQEHQSLACTGDVQVL